MIVTDTDVAAISAILGDAAHVGKRTLLWTLRDAQSNAALAVTLSWGVDLSMGMQSAPVPANQPFTVISAQTPQGYFELHNVTAYLCIEPDEVMFIARHEDTFSSMVIGKACTCSQFSNINHSLIKADLTRIDPTLLMAAMQLSLAETLFESLP